MSNEIFAEVVELLYGGGGNDIIAKMNPAGSDLSTADKDKRKRKITAGLSAVGAGAGAAGLAVGGNNLRRAYRGARTLQGAGAAVKGAKKAAFKSAVGEEKLATGLIPLEVAGLTGEVAATKILHGDTKKKGALVKKDLELVNNAKTAGKRELTRATIATASSRKKGLEYTKKTGGALRRLPAGVTGHAKVEKALKTRSRAESVAGHAAMGAGVSTLPVSLSRHAGTKKGAAIVGGTTLAGAGYGALKPLTHPHEKGHKFLSEKKKVKKSDQVEVVWSGEIAKADVDKQQIFGWASVVEVNGEPVVDLQGDVITVDEMEKAGYEYVMKSRKGGDMHLRDDRQPIQKSEMIESFIVTDEKRQALGLPESVPAGWWVGFQVQDPDVWAKVRSGERTGFSMHGRGHRAPVS